ncbi:energy-coupling factor ABC transporter permease [Facklamia sp. DSM 111018]|uniref:Cobalt transport protein CbiM n=1 Tax=Facklamia lactis TaxID=2749967 RepID=A0ABS0LPC0_9LACT|nr:energy-coupling factor ABC transporter permease [Facklamia lactis]MBG9979513.1 energy-coupling factor ABC transporter permease [Facklamia lactis]MBG9985817.1 energy-coupling factor ABC transporter permease [Facklamia lactis]
MKNKMSLALCIVGVVSLVIVPTAHAMHIMEGYLPLKHALIWGALCIPFIGMGIKKLSDVLANNRKVIIVLAMAGAYAFVLSALKIPSVTGSSSHPTGTGLVTIFFGPSIGAVVSFVVLIFQAILLAHGGLTTLGANTFSMGIVGPLVTYAIYKIGKTSKLNKHFVIFLAAALGDLMTYVATSIQLALAHPSAVGGVMESFTKFASVFAVTQVPIAIIEGILTVVVIMSLESVAKSELTLLGYSMEG